MKVLPKSIVERRELNLRQGIKSSLSNIRSIVALVYTLYRSNNRKAVVEYSESTNGGLIKLQSTLENSIKTLLGLDDLTFINDNPLFKSQMEALQVGIELIFKLGKVEFIDGTLASSAERTGGNRYNKRIRFGINIQIIDIFLSCYEADLTMFLNKWLHNQESEKREIDEGMKKILTIFSEETQFKIRYNNQETCFQQEGIYQEFVEGNTVISRDEHENVGPFRVFKSYVKEGLHPYISENSDEFVAKNITADALEYYQIVSNTLDLIPKRTQITAFISQDNNKTIEKTSFAALSEQMQIIYYGCPGTGKSHIIKKHTEKESVVRTTFHPDSDYSTFVGCYKPTTKPVAMRDVTGKVIMEHGEAVTEDRIIYKFVDQAFLQAYIKAWKFYAETAEGNNPKKQFLIIEEINRGNCAQIFGDLFQLLDRNGCGFSDYYIHADNDMKSHLAAAFKDITIDASHKDVINAMYHHGEKDVVEMVLQGEILLLPNNLYIWATMNTSDQSLFPIDSAFKRRWDWKYRPIVKGRGENGNELIWRIAANTKEYNWWSFLEKINVVIGSTTNSEDKKLGFFFCKAIDDVISAETFVGKVIFYLWNDVFKNFGFDEDIFKDEKLADGTYSTLDFDKFYTTNTDGDTIVRVDKVERFLENLKVKVAGEIITEGEDEDGNTSSSSTRDYTKYSINGVGKYGKNPLASECVKEYVKLHPELSAEEVVANWKSLGNIVPHFVELEEEHNARTDNSDRSIKIECGETFIYVENNGYGKNGKVDILIDAINQKDWGIKVEKYNTNLL